MAAALAKDLLSALETKDAQPPSENMQKNPLRYGIPHYDKLDRSAYDFFDDLGRMYFLITEKSFPAYYKLWDKSGASVSSIVSDGMAFVALPKGKKLKFPVPNRGEIIYFRSPHNQTIIPVKIVSSFYYPDRIVGRVRYTVT